MQIKDEHGIYEGTLIENEIMKFKSELYIIHILIKVYRKNKGKERIFFMFRKFKRIFPSWMPKIVFPDTNTSLSVFVHSMCTTKVSENWA